MMYDVCDVEKCISEIKEENYYSEILDLERGHAKLK